MKPNGTDPSAPTALQPSTVLRACSVRMPSTVLRIIRNTSFMRRKRKPRSVSPVHPLDVNIAVSDIEIRPLAGYDAAAPVLSAKITSEDAKALWGTAAESEPLRDAAEQSTRTIEASAYDLARKIAEGAADRDAETAEREAEERMRMRARREVAQSVASSLLENVLARIRTEERHAAERTAAEAEEAFAA